MYCPKCGGTLRYQPICNMTNVGDGWAATQTGRHAGAAFASGHPVAGVAHLLYRGGVYAARAVAQKILPWRCERCGQRSN